MLVSPHVFSLVSPAVVAPFAKVLEPRPRLSVSHPFIYKFCSGLRWIANEMFSVFNKASEAFGLVGDQRVKTAAAFFLVSGAMWKVYALENRQQEMQDELNRQGVEQARQGQVLGEMHNEQQRQGAVQGEHTSTLAEQSRQLSNIEGGVTGVQADLVSLAKQLRDLEAAMEERLNNHGAQLTLIQKNGAAQNTKLDSIESSITTNFAFFNTRFENLGGRLDTLEGSLSTVQRRVEEGIDDLASKLHEESAETRKLIIGMGKTFDKARFEVLEDLKNNNSKLIALFEQLNRKHDPLSIDTLSQLSDFPRSNIISIDFVPSAFSPSLLRKKMEDGSKKDALALKQ
jgi:hypothetical protein